MEHIKHLIAQLQKGDKKALSRCITIVENGLQGTELLLSSLKFNRTTPVIGITGPPGAGKSTLINAILKRLSGQGKKTGILAIDPSSPFTHGSLLGDRIRMGEHFSDENIFIRSVATRGSLGGLSAKTIEITDVMKAFGFDYIIIETVGIGQSEVEIVGLADTTVLVLVPEAGDEVQTLKAGVMEIADVFVVNKSDRDGADLFIKNLHQVVHENPSTQWTPTVIKSVAIRSEGVEEVLESIHKHQEQTTNTRTPFLLAEKAYKLIREGRMKDINKDELRNSIENSLLADAASFNLYKFVRQYY